MLFPKPPNIIFPINVAIKAPRISIENGVLSGIISPKNNPGKILKEFFT